MIPQEFIEEVQQRTDIVEVISSYIPLKKSGRNFRALCPFHGEKTPSFFVSPQKQIFHCFGCGKGGGVLQFLMLYDRLSFVEAVEVLAKRLGLEIPYERVFPRERMKNLLFEVVQQAMVFFHHTLLTDTSAQKARQYLKGRGINEKIIKYFKLGYARGDNVLINYMRKRGVTLDALEKASLITSRSNGGYIDLFRNRIVFPIFDVRNRPVGFGARTIEDTKEGVPKYINSLENPLYSKREHLFGLNFAKEEVLRKDSIIVTEGYLDMIMPFAAGIKNVVASLGTALTIEQVRLVKRYTKNIILIFDSDKAGQNATLRALDFLLEEGLDVSIVELPEGFDVDLIVRKKGKDYFLNLLERNKKDFFDYKIGVLSKIYDIESIAGKTKIAHEMLLAIKKLGSEIEKFEYIKKLASSLDVREAVLVAELSKLEGIKQPVISDGDRFSFPVPLAEKLLIRILMNNPHIIKAIKEKVMKDDFSHPLSRRAYSLLVDNFSATSFSLTKFMGILDDKELSGFISHITMENFGILDKTVLKDCIAKIRKNRIKGIKRSIQEEIKLAEKNKDMGRLKELMAQFKKINSEVRNG